MSDLLEEKLYQRFEQGHARVIGIGGDLRIIVGDAEHNMQLIDCSRKDCSLAWKMSIKLSHDSVS
jgi:hypothetical protein